MKKKPKVVIVTAWPSTYRVDFFRYLIKEYKQYEFHIVFSSMDSSMAVKINQEQEPYFHFLDSKLISLRKKMDGWYIIISYGLTKLLNRIKPDVLIGSEYNLTIQEGLTWAKLHRVPYLCWSDATAVSERELSKIQWMLRKRVIHSAEGFIASSTRTKELLVKYGAPVEEINISYLTVNIEKYLHPTERAGNKIIYVGALIHRKGVDLLLKAIAKMEQPVELSLVGSGTDEEVASLKQLAKELEIEKCITFHGQKSQSDLKKLYAQHDIFVLPTREDCFGLVILEAMCSSMPVIVSLYADGAYDLIEEGRNGYIVDPYDTESFAKVMDRAVSEPMVQISMGKRSYCKAQEFHFSKVAVAYMNSIEQAMKKGKENE